MLSTPKKFSCRVIFPSEWDSYLRAEQHDQLHHRRAGLHTHKACIGRGQQRSNHMTGTELPDFMFQFLLGHAI